MSEQNQQVKRRMDEALQEIRIVLPGTQALLGFQFVAFFNTAFKELSSSLQAYHLVNLLFTTCCTVLLITPVAYHELREDGRHTERWLRFTSRMLSLAMLFLLAGLAGDIFVAANMLNMAVPLRIGAAGFVFLFGALMWFIQPLIRRR
jgi:hypothetical protein